MINIMTHTKDQVTKVHTKGDRSPRQIPMELIEDALNEHRGNVSQASKTLATSYSNLSRIVDGTAHLIALCESYRTELIDMAEANLRVSLEEGSMKATLFTLTRLGKDRGYAEKKELETTTITKSAVDLSKMTTAQLSQMRDLVTEAGLASGDIIDVTPESSD